MPSVVFYVWISMMLIGLASLVMVPLLYIMYSKPNMWRNLAIAGIIALLIMSIGCGCCAIIEIAKQSEEGVWKLPFENHITYLFDRQAGAGLLAIVWSLVLGILMGFLHRPTNKFELQLDVD